MQEIQYSNIGLDKYNRVVVCKLLLVKHKVEFMVKIIIQNVPIKYLSMSEKGSFKVRAFHSVTKDIQSFIFDLLNKEIVLFIV